MQNCMYTNEGLVDDYFLAHCFYRFNKLTLKNYMNVYPGPQELYNSKHMDMSPTRRVCITYTVPCNHIATG